MLNLQTKEVFILFVPRNTKTSLVEICKLEIAELE